MSSRTTTLGAFPKPTALTRARWMHRQDDLDDAGLAEAENKARQEWFALQSELGLELWADGQFERGDMVSYFTDQLEGCEPAGLVRCIDNRYYRRPRVEEPIVRDSTLAVLTWKRAQKAAGNPVKAVLTGPYTLMDFSFDEHYESREACCRAFAAALREEVQELVTTGAKEIQLDEPALSGRPGEIGWAKECIEHVLEPAKGKARTWLHCYLGDLSSIAGELFKTEVDGIHLDLAHGNAGLLDQHAFPADKILGAGVIDAWDPAPDADDEIRARVQYAQGKVDADRLWLSPDAGMGQLTWSQAEAKLRSLVRVANEG